MPWIFGYGSIIWKPEFEFEEQKLARLQGYKRRFWQGSTDHRGVPGDPGRVVTLLPEEGSSLWGVAFRLRDEVYEPVLERLDHREKNGYDRRHLEVEFADGGSIKVLIYMATAENPHYLGPASYEDMAAQILRCQGPSGTNIEYLERLHLALLEYGVQDAHLVRLWAAVERLRRPG